MHWIQKDILRKLSKADTQRYSELKPKDVEGNLFMYHRGLLVSQGLIEKMRDGYGLTSAGKDLIASLSLSRGKTIISPRNLIAVVYRSDDRYLLYRWNRQPYRGLVSLPFGRLHAGWKILDMAAEQLYYKSGLPVDNWKIRGTVNLLSNGPMGHSLIMIAEASGKGGEPSADGLTGEPFWGKPKSDLVPGFAQIISLIDTKPGLFFEDITG